MKENTPNSKKKSPITGLAVFFVILMISSLLQETPRRGSREAVLTGVLTLLVILVTALLAGLAARKAAARGAASAPARGNPARTQPVPARPYQTHPAPQARPRPAPGSRLDLSGPDAYCLVCDQTGVDHFERDRQRRLRQIDYWLSIGLIERREYNQLRERYSRDVPHQNGR